MSQGALLFPPGYTPLHDGEPVPSGKLRFRRTGTTTNQATYSDSALQTANANPIELDASGMLEDLCYGDPSTGFDYRVELLSSDDAVLWTLDDVVVDGADTSTYQEGSFTATVTGHASNPTGTVNYRIFGNSAGTGKLCYLQIASSILAESNSTAMTLTGLPSACQPSMTVWVPCNARDNGVDVSAAAEISTGAPSTIVFYTDAPLSATGWTNSGSKGLVGGTTISYLL